MNDLFSRNGASPDSKFPNQQTIVLPGDGEQCTLIYIPEFLSPEESSKLFNQLLDNTPWQQSRIRIAGRSMPIPRLNAWYGDRGANYGYSGTRLRLNPWTQELMRLRQRMEQISQHCFNSALLNLYRDGNDSVAWHSDDETELGHQPVIASLSLGAVRRFQLKRKQGGERYQLSLHPGALLVMSGATQQLWQHRILKEKSVLSPRIIITFRRVVE